MFLGGHRFRYSGEFAEVNLLRALNGPILDSALPAGYHRRPRDTEGLFDLRIDHVLHTFWENWPKPGVRPIRRTWHAAGTAWWPGQARIGRVRPGGWLREE